MWVNKFHGEPPTGSSKQVNDVHLYDELKQLRREKARLKEERELSKRWQPSSPNSHAEIHLYQATSERIQYRSDVSGV